MRNDALETANQENQCKNTQLHEKLHRAENNAQQRQSRRDRYTRGN